MYTEECDYMKQIYLSLRIVYSEVFTVLMYLPQEQKDFASSQVDGKATK